jgi:hypothetical protein
MTNASVRGIQMGDITHFHDQSMTPQSFRVMKIHVSNHNGSSLLSVFMARGIGADFLDFVKRKNFIPLKFLGGVVFGGFPKRA